MIFDECLKLISSIEKALILLLSSSRSVQLAKKASGLQKKRKNINDRVKWIDVDKAFDSRVKTSIVVNLVHKDVLTFLDDAKHSLFYMWAEPCYRPNLVSSYQQYKDELNFSGIKLPVRLKDVANFEKKNNISVNVHGLIKKGQRFSLVRLHLTSEVKDTHVHLLRVEKEYVNEDSSDEEGNNGPESRTQSYNVHYLRIKDLSRLVSRQLSYNDSLTFYKSCPDGVEPAKWFSLELLLIANSCEIILASPVLMQKLTSEQKEAFVEATICHICQKALHLPMKKVSDHCHLTEKYLGPAYQHCNLAYQDSNTIPLVKVLALNKEKYISLTKYVQGTQIKFRFIDSFRFMASSLEKLASYLTEYKIISEIFSGIESEKVERLTRKGVFPYEYLDSRARLRENQLSPKEKFYSTLNDTSISDEDYKHAKKVWCALSVKTIGEYVRLYMKTDVFENFREQCLVFYGLDPANYYTAPGYTWDTILKYTGVRLELLPDVDMLLIVENSKKGGVSQCANRYAIAINKYTIVFNESREVINIVYFDANDLYGWAMGHPLPYGSFEWVTNLENFDFNVPDDSPIGYILEVDLCYPPELHKEHSDLPFCPEPSEPPGFSQEKLLTTLLLKQKYVIYYRALKHAVANSLVLIKIHRVLKFNQSTWLKSYIDFKTEKRALAQIYKMYKLMNNAVYGKTMENVRKHVNLKVSSTLIQYSLVVDTTELIQHCNELI
ncbi:uncharacterized protein LOC117177247 [Belonocnema kinseyi]|uniref:uncharacterized protein LOC117177247 n=1 Tax=Belonocnema kinseyi TaxID=2817044 RepID=UPI00143D99FF|nr:uncharacterized protein LOC117177247 [Belonocnema kinseyi]